MGTVGIAAAVVGGPLAVVGAIVDNNHREEEERRHREAEQQRLNAEARQRQEQERQEQLARQQREQREEQERLQRQLEETKRKADRLDLLTAVQHHSPETTMDELDNLENFFVNNPATAVLSNITCLIGLKGAGKTTLLYLMGVVPDPPVQSTQDQTVNFAAYGDFLDTVGTVIEYSSVCRFIAVLLKRGILPKHFIFLHGERISRPIQILKTECEFRSLSYLNILCRDSYRAHRLVVDDRLDEEVRNSFGLDPISSTNDIVRINQEKFSAQNGPVSFPSIVAHSNGNEYRVKFDPKSKINYKVLRLLKDFKEGNYSSDKDFINA
jgi:hypothetical protein